MTQLKLSPLPSLRSDNDSGAPDIGEGFVDEAVVMAMLARPGAQREFPEATQLALAADDMDFAGWRLQSAASPQPIAPSPTRPAAIAASAPRPTPPIPDNPGLGASRGGNHRWWLAGLAGATSTLVFSVLLVSLSTRSSTAPGDNLIAETLSKPRSLVLNEFTVLEPIAPQLTEISPWRSLPRHPAGD